MGSYVLWAFAALVLCDLFCKTNWQNLKVDHYASPNRSMVWWTVEDFRKQKPAPDFVLMGSSLLMHVLHGGDAEYLKLAQNEVCHHKAAMLEDLIAKKTGVRVNSFAFALAGMMASDTYAISSTLFKGEQKPKVIVYGIAPRDFIDNTLASPASTEIFRFMSRTGGLHDVGWDARTGIWEKVEYAIENLSSLYEHRNYFVYLQHRYAKGLLRLIGYENNNEVHTPFALRRLALLENQEDIGVNERIAMPGLKRVYTNNSQEYLRRYQPFKVDRFKTQLSYLEKFMAYCSKEGIEVVLVNMPVTEDNLKLMAPASYDAYKNNVTAIAEKYQGRFIDLQDSKKFDVSLFCDSAHMTGLGGVKFFNELAGKITDGSRLAVGRNSSWQ